MAARAGAPTAGLQRPSVLALAARESAVAACVAFALALPLLGLRLADTPGGVVLETRFEWVWIAIAAVFAGRFALVLWRVARRGRASEVALP